MNFYILDLNTSPSTLFRFSRLLFTVRVRMYCEGRESGKIDKYRLAGCRNISHYYQQQSFYGVSSPTSYDQSTRSSHIHTNSSPLVADNAVCVDVNHSLAHKVSGLMMFSFFCRLFLLPSFTRAPELKFQQSNT